MGQAGSTQAWALRPDVVATVLDEGAVLLDLESKYFYAVNASGWALVQLFELGTILDAALRCCDDWSDGTGRSDAQRFIDMLFAERLVQPCDAAKGAEVVRPRPWTAPTLEKQAEPLQRVIVSAFDPSIPLAE
jgi:hypothetical protein